jgi:hypothetical protein
VVILLIPSCSYVCGYHVYVHFAHLNYCVADGLSVFDMLPGSTWNFGCGSAKML